MADLSNKCVCVADNGLFISFAQELSKYFGKVLYLTLGNDGPFPMPYWDLVGDGFPGIEKVLDLSDAKRHADCFAFPDVGNAGLVEYLRERFPVWGSGEGSELELGRRTFKQIQEDLGLEVAPYQVCHGLTELTEYLDSTEDCYVKLSRYRGLAETFHHQDPDKTKVWLAQRRMQLGPLAEYLNFLCEDPVEAVSETGLDTFFSGGQFPSVAIQGIENKDRAYIGTVTPWKELPKALTRLPEALVPHLIKVGYCNFLSTEVRITEDGKNFCGDLTARHASPAGESLLKAMSNLGDVVWAGAHNEFVEPEWSAKFTVQALIQHPDPKEQMRLCTVDEDLPWVAFYAACRDGNTICFPPFPWVSEMVGSLQATGDTISEAIETIKERTEVLEETGLIVHTRSLVDVLKSIENQEEEGTPFTDKPVPDPAEVAA